MHEIKNRYISSAMALKFTRNLVLCAMMAALSIVLSYTTSFYITPTIKVGFSGLPNRLVDFLFGPVVGCIFGGMMDVIKFFIKPDGAFFFGYTLSAMAGGLIYGTFFYKIPVKQVEHKESGHKVSAIIRKNLRTILLIFIAEVLVKLFVNCGLNTLWSSMMSGKAYLAILPARLLKNLIQIPTDTVLHFILIFMFQRLRRYLISE